MRKHFLFLSIFLYATSAFCQHPLTATNKSDHQIQLQINRNVELLGFVYFLGYEGRQLESSDDYLSGRKIKKKDWYGYGLSLYRKYKSFENSKNLAVAIGFAENIWLDYLINLLLQLDDFPNARLKPGIEAKYYIRFSTKRDSLEAKTNAGIFIDALNKLYKEVSFDKYLSDNQKKYKNAISQVQSGLPDQRFVPAMESFYRQRFDHYTLTPSLTIPTGMGFGVKFSLDDKTRVFHVFGPFTVQHFTDEANLNMGFRDEKHLLELSTHEFGHSFVNPAIDQLPKELISSTEVLFAPIKDAMSNQGYNNWKSCVYEHFVRAGEIIIAQNLRRTSDAQRLRLSYQQNRKFIYLPQILEELDAYNKTKTITYQQAVESAMKRLQTKTLKN